MSRNNNTFCCLGTHSSDDDESGGPKQTLKVERKNSKERRRLQRLDALVENGKKLDPNQAKARIRLQRKYPTNAGTVSKQKLQRMRINRDKKKRRLQKRRRAQVKRDEDKEKKRRARLKRDKDEEEERARLKRDQDEEEERARLKRDEEEERARRKRNARGRRTRMRPILWRHVLRTLVASNPGVPATVFVSIEQCLTLTNGNGCDKAGVLSQVRKCRRHELRKYHPDRGGDKKVAQSINHVFDQIMVRY